MRSSEVLIDAFDRVRQNVHSAVGGLSPEQLTVRLDSQANSIAWLVWHLTRIQDDHVADVAGTRQAWIAEGWVDFFGLPFDPLDTGFGHGSDDVAAVRVDSGDVLTGYHDAAYARTVSYLERLADADLDRVVDESWTPVVTLGARLVSVANEDAQHVGQAAFVRGVVERGAVPPVAG
ncbi:putative damage-inducible protein DinB [Haloactinopolyspora alba]|uniref:Putative damage-inducible protein DinB n=1 Tax=Haloactinopolyspora alba TaxID=648780 RepID=A0A2P8DHD9_9ACTN|nr:DinB family protein [Haloactinopolyspora alba]PSK96637.1 putative damage-inducible protein DinB [Haloactinopolyspora alba]